MFDIIKLSAFVIGITQVLAEAGVPKKLLPVLAVIIGGLLNPALIGNWEFTYIAQGAFVGLSATGLVAFTDNRLQKIAPMTVEEEFNR